MNLVYTVVLVLAAVTLARCDCPVTRIHKVGDCSFQIVCYNDVSGFHLPLECQYSNYPATVKLILHNPTVSNDTNVDLKMITSFKSYGKWPRNDLNMVEQMYGLTELELVGNQIERIDGTPFKQLFYLEKVDLSHNQLSNIENLFRTEMESSKLRILLLAYNDIENLSGNIFDSVPYLEELDLSHNSISNLNSDSFSNLNRLKQLKLAYNKIDNIPDDIFLNSTSLEELDLSNNSISNLNNNSFSNLTRLRVLKLTNNNIVDLDSAINSLKLLKHLYIRGNQIQSIKKQSLQVIYDLETFDASANHLDKIFPDMLARHWMHFNSYTRCRILLSDNDLTSLPNATSEHFIKLLSNMEEKNFVDFQMELDVSKNSISTIEPYAFQYIFHLSSLDLSRNKLTTFVINADDLKHVKYLNLSYNFIRNLDYESFSSMHNLQNLDLSFNQLDIILDPTFLTNNVLRFVNMSDNYLRDITNLNFQFDTVGGVLDLTKNSLSVINIPQGKAIRLMILILRSNNIADSSLIELSQQNELKYLDMSYNYIKGLNESSLHLPSGLEYFDLTFNEIQFIAPSVFKDLTHLKTLRLSHNLIEHIEYGVFQRMSALQHLDLSNNEISTLDSKVFTDLKSLQTLSVRNNGMYYLDYKSWIGHDRVVRVNMDGNSFDCQWLAAAISDFDNGISMIEPATTDPVYTGNNLKGITCVENAPQALMDGLDADRTLLVIASNILEAIREQTKLIKAQYRYQTPSLHQVPQTYNEVK